MYVFDKWLLVMIQEWKTEERDRTHANPLLTLAKHNFIDSDDD
jgi:hypothetical protein